MMEHVESILWDIKNGDRNEEYFGKDLELAAGIFRIAEKINTTIHDSYLEMFVELLSAAAQIVDYYENPTWSKWFRNKANELTGNSPEPEPAIAPEPITKDVIAEPPNSNYLLDISDL